ncbi:MAG: hypothetical protein JW852_03855 [Spirochaetales bacterium]|nr:hypothetical protein [Spirochaetales bacterium]
MEQMCTCRGTPGEVALTPAILPAIMLAAGLFIAGCLAGCGGYYTADIAGYVKDDESRAGVNGAIIRIYAQEPEDADADGFTVETASMATGGNAGYYSHKIIWRNWFPAFGDEGDSGSVWLGISHDDYAPAVTLVQGIISETVNVVPDIYLVRATFSSQTVTGRVIDVGGDGVNGVRVVLDLESTPDDEEDYITTTGTVNAVEGVYEFDNVTWRDESPDSPAADTESALVYVDDGEYDAAQPASVLITSGGLSQAADEIVVTRQPREDFSVNIRGRCINRYLSTQEVQEIPAQGIGVTLTCTDDDGEHTLYDYTDAGGVFTFFVQWTDATPGNFDGTTDVAGVDPGIPDGEDGLFVQLHFDPPFDAATVGGDIDGGDPAVFDNQDFFLKSWINPNYLPDTVIETTL